MVFTRNICIAAMLIALSGPAGAEEIPGSSFGYGNWEGAAYTFTGTNEFSHCAISVGFVSGDTLYFGVNQDATITVGVASENYNLVADQSFPVALYVDRRQPFYATATAIDRTFAVLTIEDFPAAMDAFGRGRTLRMESAQATGNYDLTGSFRALEAARQCAINQLQIAAKNPPTVTNTPTAPQPPAQPSSGLPPPSGDTSYHGN